MRPSCNFIEAKLLFELGKDGEDSLPIGIVEKADEPEHEDHPPLVGEDEPVPGRRARPVGSGQLPFGERAPLNRAPAVIRA